jgi:hypothetical protein
MKTVASLLLACLAAAPVLAQKPERPLRIFAGGLQNTQKFTSLGASYDVQSFTLGNRKVDAGILLEYSFGKDKSSATNPLIRGGGIQLRTDLTTDSSKAHPYVGLGINSLQFKRSGSVPNGGSFGAGATNITVTTAVGFRFSAGYELPQGYLAELAYFAQNYENNWQYRIGYRF